MSELIGFALLSFTSFFTLINPIGTMPIFMTMTADLDTPHRNYTARKASIAGNELLTWSMYSPGRISPS
jgi:multiple antibiotic resistance protein